MATINPIPSQPVRNGGIDVFTWETLTEADTAVRQIINGLGPLAASVQVTGTFGGATVVLQGSNDGTNWVTLQDFEGDDISLTAAGARDFSTAMLYVRPSASGGSSQDIDITLVSRS